MKPRATRLWIAAALAGLLSVGATPSAGQAFPQEPEVVVTAPEQSMVERYVRELTDPVRTGQLPVWNSQICPGIIGISKPRADVLAKRIRQIGALVQLKAGRRGCRPNILVVFTQDAEALATGLAQRLPTTLGQDGRGRLRQFGQSTAPVRWISLTEDVALDAVTMPGMPGQGPSVGRLVGSRLAESTRAVIGFVFVIVDARQIAGVTLGDLGDYLGMIAVARPRLEAMPSSNSILALFGQRPATPGGLSDADRAYLVGLYRAPIAGKGQVQRSAIRTTMEQNVPAPGSDRP